MSPHSVAAVMMILITLVTTAHCINNNTRSSSTWCDGGRTDDPSCLIGGTTDLDSDEFMMDSEISRRILAGISFTKNVQDSSKAVSCDRSTNPQCHAGQGNPNPPGPDCAKATYNRQCHRYP